MIREVPISPLTPAQQQELERRIAASDRGELTYFILGSREGMAAEVQRNRSNQPSRGIQTRSGCSRLGFSHHDPRHDSGDWCGGSLDIQVVHFLNDSDPLRHQPG
jgi:hypothetical protein